MKELKTCIACNTQKEKNEFYKSSKGCKNGLTARCKKCHGIQTKQWMQNNKDRIPAYHRKHSLKGRYGISLDDFEQLKNKQLGKCAICGDIPDETKPSQANKLHVDHCHERGNIRGLLCHLCNRGIGLFKENVETLHKAIDYLKNH